MTPMAAKDVMLTLFLTAWTAAGLPASRIVWDDKADSIPTGEQAWARVTIKHGDAPTRAFGNQRALYAVTGNLFIQTFTPAGGAQVIGLSLAHAVVTAFRRAGNEGVSFRNTRFKEVGTSGAFEQINVLTDFSYDD